MRSLFLKIFFWFWATVIATGAALILTFIMEPRSVPSRWHATLIDTARFSGTIAVETAERRVMLLHLLTSNASNTKRI